MYQIVKNIQLGYYWFLNVVFKLVITVVKWFYFNNIYIIQFGEWQNNSDHGPQDIHGN